MATLAQAVSKATHDLAAARIPSPGIDARLLLCAAVGIDRAMLIREPDRLVPPEAAARFAVWIDRRRAREPVSRILGTRAFWGIELRLTPDVLDPRPETEILVEAVLDAVADRRSAVLRILDLGTGSGAILCALLHELPRALGWAVDRSAAACRVAHTNLSACGVASRSLVLRGDWASALPPGAFDVVVSNPPYIETATIADLDPDVRDHDPLAALDGGADGLAAYRVLVPDLPRLLDRGGVTALEIGRGQDVAVMALLVRAGLSSVATRPDLAGIGRVVMARGVSATGA